MEISLPRDAYKKALVRVCKHNGISHQYASDEKLASELEIGTKKNLTSRQNVIISGISGSGKTTLAKILETVGFNRLPNVVTRPRRFGESLKDNVFVTEEEFSRLNNAGNLFNPHSRNKTMHAILKSDLTRLTTSNSRIYLDKSVSSATSITRSINLLGNVSFLYILAPSLDILYNRITQREQSKYGSLNRTDIISRLNEEITDMQRTINLPYSFLVNDSLDRVEKLLRDNYS